MSDAEAETSYPTEQQQQDQQGSDSKQQKTEGGSSSGGSGGGVSGVKKILLLVGVVIVFCSFIVVAGAEAGNNGVAGAEAGNNGVAFGLQGAVEVLLPALLGLVLIFKSDADITMFVIFFVGLAATLWSFFSFVVDCRANKNNVVRARLAGHLGFFVGECLLTVVGAMGLF